MLKEMQKEIDEAQIIIDGYYELPDEEQDSDQMIYWKGFIDGILKAMSIIERRNS